MLEWLIPIGLFWIAAAVYVGGAAIEIKGGGGLQQVLGLLATFAIYLLLWWALRTGLGGLGMVGRVIVPTAVVLAGIPWIARGGFRATGVVIRPVEGDAASH